MFHRLSVSFTYIMTSVFFKLEIKDKNLVFSKKPFILASNHLSNLDPPLLSACCSKRIRILAKNELFENKILGAYLRDLGSIPLNRGKAGISVIKLCLKILKNESLLIFPQGSRNRSLDDALSGVGFLARKAGVPIIVAKIYGTDKVFTQRLRLFNRLKIKIIFNLLDNIVDSDTYRDISLKVVNRIKSL